MQIPRSLRLLSQGLLFFFALIGGVLSLAQLQAVWQPSDARSVIIKTEDVAIVTQGFFAPRLTFGGVPVGSDQLVETTITLWRDGGAPITEDMVRRPLEFRMPPGSRVAAVELLDQESSIPDNFKVENSESAVSVTWKVFDPDMAVKIAVARFGSLEPTLNSDTLGPGVTVTHNRYNTAKSVYYWGITFLMVAAFGTTIISAITFGGDAVFERAGKVIGRLPQATRPFIGVIGSALYMGLVVGIVFFGLRFVPWLLGVVVPPVPFS